MIFNHVQTYDNTANTRAQHVNLFITVLCIALVIVYSLADTYIYTAAHARFISQLDEAPQKSYIVRHGDSLWTIAQDMSQTPAETASVCAWLESYNNLKGRKLTEGQMIYIPLL